MPAWRGCAERSRVGPRRRRGSRPASATSAVRSYEISCTRSRRPTLRTPPVRYPSLPSEPQADEKKPGAAMDSITLERAAVSNPAKHDLQRALRRLGLAAALLVPAVRAAWYAQDWWTVGRFIESTDDAYVGGNITPLAPHVDAFIDQILVTDNERVHAGQVLVQLDQRDYRAALDHAEAALNARQAAAASLRAQYGLQQSMIRQQEADLSSKKARATFTAQDAVRYRALAQTSYGSRQNQERTSSLEQEAQSAVAAAQAGLDAARQQLKVLEAQIAE